MDMAHQLLKGLQYIHARRIIHCDLKPANIFITRTQVFGAWIAFEIRARAALHITSVPVPRRVLHLGSSYSRTVHPAVSLVWPNGTLFQVFLFGALGTQISKKSLPWWMMWLLNPRFSHMHDSPRLASSNVDGTIILTRIPVAALVNNMLRLPPHPCPATFHLFLLGSQNCRFRHCKVPGQ